MRKYIIKLQLIAAVSLLTLVGCQPDMELSNPNAITTGSYYQTQEQLIVAVNACYNSLSRPGLYGRYAYYSFLSRGDDFTYTAKAVGIPEIIPVSTFSALSNNYGVLFHWQDLYAGVYSCNLALEKIDEAPNDIPEEVKNRLRGEAYFLRAFYNLQLGINFGEEVPHIERTPQTSEDLYRGNAPKGLLYQKIVEDLLNAIELLPTREVMYADRGNTGRAHKGSAQGMLARAYLYRPILDWNQPAEFDKAEAVLKDIIDSQEFSLVENFRDNHTEDNENNDESLFEVQFLHDFGTFNPTGPKYVDGNRNNSTWRMQEVGMLDGVGGSWWNMSPTPIAVNQFEEGDPRLYMSIWCPGGALYFDRGRWAAFEDLNYPEGQFAVRKYCTDEATGDWETGINDRIIRYADVLLMYAECLNERGDVAGAATYVNMVRARANNVVPSEQDHLWYQSSPGTIPTVEALISSAPTINGVVINSMTRAIRHERFVELFGEYVRYYDLLRWSMAANDPVNLVEVLGHKGFQSGREFMPYPEAELSVNPNLKPGPGNF